jgi:hypothetical protein
MALIPADNAGDADSVANAEVWYLKTPVTSTKGFAFYVKALNAAMKRPPFAVTTEIKLQPDAKTQFKMSFSPGDVLEMDVIRAVMAKKEEIQEQLTAPYAPPPPEEEKPVVAKKVVKRKF